MRKRLAVTHTLALILFFCLSAHKALPATEKPAKGVVKDGQGELAPGNCLTDEEAELARLINRLRSEHQLPAIRVTGALYKVAKWHVIDLALFSPHKDKTDSRGKPCDLRSWSDKGEGRGGWKPLCYTSDHQYAKELWGKPREISDFRGAAYENIYWTSAPLSPSMVINCWENRKEEKELILELGAWKESRWASMGIGIYGGYAAVWISDSADSADTVESCKKALPIP